jgi:hypothetical protein
MQIGDALNAGDDFKLRFHASVAAQDRASTIPLDRLIKHNRGRAPRTP